MTVLFQPVDIKRSEPYDDRPRQQLIAELRVEFGKHPAPSTLPADDPRHIEWLASCRPHRRQYVRPAAERRCLDTRNGPGCGTPFRHRNKALKRCVQCSGVTWSSKGMRG